MSLKNHKTLPWICCMLAALFLSAGLTILSIDNREIANDEILSSEVSYVLDSESEFPVWDTEIAMPPYGETESTSEEGAGILPFAGFGLLAAGGILSVFFLFVMRQKRPYLGPETELFLLSLCIPLIRRFLLNAPVFLGRAVWVFLPSSVRIGILWVLFSAALVCARGILGWLRSGFPRTPAWTSLIRLFQETKPLPALPVYLERFYTSLWYPAAVLCTTKTFLSASRNQYPVRNDTLPLLLHTKNAGHRPSDRPGPASPPGSFAFNP